MAGHASQRWIAVDWGTSNLRAWLMEDDAPQDSAASDAGMSGLSQSAFEPALLALVAPWLSQGMVTPVIACGMVGARQGWVEAPYAPVPGRPLDHGSFVAATVEDPRIAVTIVHGLAQSSPPDVMRGEETQIAGLLAREPGFGGLACLPGTHAKWVRIAGGRVESFTTFMTGELFALLDRHSVLRHVTGDGDDEATFDAGLDAALADPSALVSGLFAIRAAALLQGLSPAAARSRLSGLLIGAELAAASRSAALDRVTIIGADALARRYARAIERAGGHATLMDGTALTLAGLASARHMLQVEGR